MPSEAAELTSLMRPALLRVSRRIRNQRVDMSVTPTQLAALMLLYAKGPMGPRELSQAERVQPPTMTKVLAALEVRGLTSRVVNPNDKRQAIITLTAAGERLVEEERNSRTEWLAARLDELTPDEREILQAAAPVLEKLANS